MFMWLMCCLVVAWPQREETRTKDRVISHLEAELRVQTGRAQQFRDLLEQNLTAHTSSNCSLNRTVSARVL